MTPAIVKIHQTIAAKPQTSTQAAEALGLPKQAVQSHIQNLLRQGLVQRVGNASKGYVYGVVR